MAKGKISGLRNVSTREANALSRLPWVRDDHLSEFGEARVLPDGRVLLYSLGGLSGGTLYPSREALAEANRQLLETERRAAEQWAGGLPSASLTLLPPIDDFLRDVDVHAASLGKTIKVAEEMLDRSVESLDAVDKAMKRIPWAKRQVREIVTPLTAYVGEVMLRVSGGRWTKNPAAKREEVAIYDPAVLAAHYAAQRKWRPIAIAAAEKAAAEARAQGASPSEADVAGGAARNATLGQLPELKPLRIEIREDNEPMIMGRDGRILQPYAVVYLPMVEPSRRIPLRAAVDVYLLPYRTGSARGSTG